MSPPVKKHTYRLNNKTIQSITQQLYISTYETNLESDGHKKMTPAAYPESPNCRKALPLY